MALEPDDFEGMAGRFAAFDSYTPEDLARNGFRQDGPGPQFRELTDKEREAVPAFEFRPWVQKDLTLIPRPEFVYSDFYARGYTSVTLAAPKVGKSMLGLAESIDMATGRGFLTGYKRDPMRVVYYNAEDDQDAIDSRVAALLVHYGIPQSEIEGRLFAHSGIGEDSFYLVSGQDPVVNEKLFVGIEKFAQKVQPGAMLMDPLQDLTRSPESNEVFRALGQRLRLMASSCNIAVGLIHHTRKVAPGFSPSIDDMRGGSALRGTARFNRVLVSMSEEEAMRAGVPNHRHFFRVGDMESNLAPPSADVNRWFEKVSVLTPNGAHVGAVQPWEWPDAMDGVTPEDARKVQLAVQAAFDAGNPPRESIQAKAWVGHLVNSTLDLGLDLSVKAEKAKVSGMVKAWIRSNVLMVVDAEDTRNGRPTKEVVAGTNNPLVVSTD